MSDERNEVDVNEEEGKERETDNWKEGTTLSGEGILPSAITVTALVISVIAIFVAVGVWTRCSSVETKYAEANLAIAELQEQVSKLSETPANSDKPASVNEDVITELKDSIAEAKKMSSENKEAISELEQSLAEQIEALANANEDLFDLQKDMESVEEKLSEHDASITALQGNPSNVEGTSSNYDKAISSIRSDVSKANDRISKVESRTTNVESRVAEVEKKNGQSGNNSSGSQNTDKKDDKKEEDSNNKYSKGTDCVYFFNAREMVKRAYNSDQITRQQLEKYVDSYLTIYNKAIRDEEISAEDVNRHNSILKDMKGVDYNGYHIKSAGSEYRRGLKDKIRYNAYRTAMEYYYEKDKIPEDEYNEYKKKAEKNSSSTSENEIRDTVDLARKLINRYIENPDKVITWDDWRGVTSVESFLSYID